MKNEGNEIVLGAKKKSSITECLFTKCTNGIWDFFGNALKWDYLFGKCGLVIQITEGLGSQIHSCQ